MATTAEETITLIRVETGEAVRNISDLRENIKAYKDALSDLEIGSREYQQVLTALQDNQAALKNAMHGTATSMEQIAAAAKGQDMSYNGLVRTMAKYKEELRAIDTSTAQGMEAFKAKAQQINAVNTELKRLDAMQGNYQRNVGNYKSALDGLAGAFKTTAGSAASVIAPVTGLTAGLKALSATPAIAVLGLLANVLNKVIDGLSSSEEATNKWNLALAGFKPLADSATRLIQGLANGLADVVTWMENVLEKWGILDSRLSDARQEMEGESQKLKELNREYMVANAKLQAEADELRAKAADKMKYNAKQREQFLRQAADNELKIFKNERSLAYRRLDLAREEAKLSQNSAASNDELARLEAEFIRKKSDYAKAQRRLTKEINATLAEQAAGTKKAATETKAALKEVDTALFDNKMDAGIKKRMDAEKEMAAEEKALADLLAEQEQEMTEAIQAELDTQLESERLAAEEEQRITQMRLQTFLSFASALSDVAGSLADIYEADADADEQAAQKAKALRTASAIISTIGGAVSAYTSTWAAAELPLSVKAVLAPVNAAAVLAAGYAQVKQINAVKVGSGASSAAVTPPAFSPAVQQVRSITGASEEARLDRMASNSRVYLVYSDIEVAQHGQRVRVAETAW